jgi:hypothetical protein
MPYKVYLQTAHWRLRACSLTIKRCDPEIGLRRERYGVPAEISKGIPFDVHHLTYERLGEERDEDLLVVCCPCHASIHGLRYWTD